MSASSASAMAAIVLSSGFDCAVKKRRTTASFRPITLASSALDIDPRSRKSFSARITSLT